MIIGVGNNYNKEGKRLIKEFISDKKYQYINCDELIDSMEFNINTKGYLDTKLKEVLNTSHNVLIDFTNLYEYKDYVDLCDYIIDINHIKQPNELGIERNEFETIKYSPETKHYHKVVNFNNNDWKKDLEDTIKFNFYNDIKVSVVVPIYNAALYLAKCIDSILNQSYKNLEVILVDDGSLDNSLDIMKRYKKLDERVKVYHKKNGGLSSTRNYGMAKATGEYIMFIDSDDYIDNNMVEILLRKILEEKADVSEGGIFVHNKDKTINEIYDFLTIDKTCSDKKELLEKYAKGFITIAAWSKMYKLDAIRDIKFDTTVFKEDSDFILRLCEKGLTFTQVPIPLYHYVKKESGSLTGNKFSPRFFNLADWCESITKELLSDKEYKDIVNQLLFNTYVHILKYYLRDFNKGILENNEYRSEIVEIYNKLVKLIANTEDVSIYRFFNNVIQILHIYIDKGIIKEEEIYKQRQQCIGIIWNSLNPQYKQEILDYMNKEGNIKYAINIDLKDQYEEFIKDIYVENHEAEGISFMKYAILKDQFPSNEIEIVYATFDVSLYEYTNKLKGFQFEKLAEIKRNIRNTYKNKISKYAFDNIFHLTMNDSEYELTDDVVIKYLAGAK